MFAVWQTVMNATVVCEDCRDPRADWLPRRWQHRCTDCAHDQAKQHLIDFPGHNVNLHCHDADLELLNALDDRLTRRLTSRRGL